VRHLKQLARARTNVEGTIEQSQDECTVSLIIQEGYEYLLDWLVSSVSSWRLYVDPRSMSNVDVDHSIWIESGLQSLPLAITSRTECPRASSPAWFDSSALAIVALHQRLDHQVLSLRLDQTLADETKTFLLVRLVDLTRLILEMTVVLDFLAFVLDQGEAECCRRSFQEVA
jgi:hypothetical protein